MREEDVLVDDVAIGAIASACHEQVADVRHQVCCVDACTKARVGDEDRCAPKLRCHAGAAEPHADRGQHSGKPLKRQMINRKHTHHRPARRRASRGREQRGAHP